MAEEKKQELSEREQLAAKYFEQNGGIEPEVKDEPAPVEAEEKKPEEKPKEEQPPKEEVKPQHKEDKFVPYDALHAERIKRKAEAEARKAAETRAAELEARIKQYSYQEPSDTISDYDRELIDTKRRLKAIEDLEKERIEREKKDNAEKMRQQMDRNIEQADKDLESEGFPGFSDMIGSVTRELQRLVEEDENNIALDNPAGWKKIFKEKVFPSAAAKFERVIKNQSLEDKIKLKQEANLVDKNGKQPPKEKDADDMTEAELRAAYMKMRGSSQTF